MKRGVIFDISVIFLFTLLGIFVTLFFEPKPIISALIFFTFPTIYMISKNRKLPYKKILTTSVLLTILIGILDILITASKGWLVPDEQLVIKMRLFGFAPIDEILWFFLLIFFLLVFYDYFIEKEKTKTLSKNVRWLVLLIGITTAIVSLLFLFGLIAKIKFVYIFVGFIYMIPPFIIIVLKKPRFIKKFFFVTLPFFLINLAHELTALKIGQWNFPGEYIGTVTLFGLSFPFEEFFFYIILGPAIGLAYYELFFDDMK